MRHEALHAGVWSPEVFGGSGGGAEIVLAKLQRQNIRFDLIRCGDISDPISV